MVNTKKMKSGKLWNRMFILLLLVNLFNGLAGMMTIPLVAKYSLSLENNLPLASTVAGLMSMVSMIICPFAGAITDRFNRKRLLIIANLGYGICLIMHSLCQEVSGLIIVRLATGVFFSVCSVTNLAFSAAFIVRERMGEGLGYVTLASVLAQALGPSIGLKLLDIGGYAGAFIGAGIFALGCMIIIQIMPYQKEKKTSVVKNSFRFSDLYAKELTYFMLMTALFSSGNGLVNTYLAIIAEERVIIGIGLFFTVYSVFLVFLKPVTGKLLDKKGIYVILIPSFIFASAGMFLIGIGTSLGVFIAASVCKALGQGSGTPSVQAYCVKIQDKNRTGVAASTIMIGQNIGNAVTPIIGSFFVSSIGYKGLFCGFSSIMLVAGILLILLQYRLECKKR